MTHLELIGLVCDLRAAQQRYARERSRSAETRCKLLERKIDYYLALLPSKEQESLFGQ